MSRRESYGFSISSDIVGPHRFPGRATSLYDKVYKDFYEEWIGYPLAMAYLLALDKLGASPGGNLLGIHARTGQINRQYAPQNSLFDQIVLGIGEPLLPDLTYDFDLKILTALSNVGSKNGQLYWLIHETELDTPELIKRYAAIFKRPEFKNVELSLEIAPLNGSPERALLLYKKFKDLGLEKVGIVWDTVHFLRGKGIDLSDKNAVKNVWDEMLNWIKKAPVSRVHFSDGKNRRDSHDMEMMRKEFAILSELGSVLTELDIPVTKECQVGLFGFKESQTAEIVSWLKDLAELEVKAGIYHAKYLRA